MATITTTTTTTANTTDTNTSFHKDETGAAAEPEFIFRSRLPDIHIPDHLSLTDYIFENASRYPHKPCLIDHSSGRTYTYADVQLLSRRVASGLSRLGISRGHVIMLLLPNCPEFVFLFLGAAMRGAVATTANPLYKPDEIHRQARSSHARLIATQAAYAGKLAQECDPHIRILTVDEALDGVTHISSLLECDAATAFVRDMHYEDDRHFSPDDIVALPYSSGTTGLPKGVMLTHRSLITSLAQQVDGENPNIHYTPDDVVLCVLPLIHIFSLNSVLLCALRAGASVAIMQRFEIVNLLEIIQRHRITMVAVVPPIVLAIAKCPVVDRFDLSSVKKVLSGAAPMGKELEDAFRARLPNAIIGQV